MTFNDDCCQFKVFKFTIVVMSQWTSPSNAFSRLDGLIDIGYSIDPLSFPLASDKI